ncbi:Hexuronate transporter [compost metagenome]|uniref:Sugar phosphate permease n=1 Tax=Pseudomonas jinjuensis TaxID=198616 RepID=A0A1H0EME0_9PSED|nr:MFS transporter [Pseudomonas jinjuensis]SDN83532.1 Sugar phosphate permease [Pseudomonas jinjuensis]
MKQHVARPADASYEWKAVTLLALGFGLVSIDRFMIMPLFPVMMRDLGLDYQDLGLITGILAVTWGISSLFMGKLSDRFGHRAVIIPAVILFSLLAGCSGLATGLLSLLLIRAVIGAAEGAYTPASIVATLEASRPSRHGLNLGIQQAAMPLFGLALAPILATQLLHHMDWHWVFALVMAPGLLVGYLLYRVLRNTDAATAAAHTSTHDAGQHHWTEVFRSRNVPLNILGMMCWLTVLVVLGAFLPNYLLDHLGLDLEQMGYVLSAIGFGGAVGTILLPSLSDRIGRKPVMVFSVIGGVVSLYLLINTGADTTRLFLWLFFTVFFDFGLICLTVGPTTTESVPATLMSTASGFVVGVGEIFGGGIAPGLAGYVAHHHGVQYTPLLALAAMSAGLLVTLSLRETAPARMASALEAT